jgi:PPP family 3-phenylpropionic acid transporter
MGTGGLLDWVPISAVLWVGWIILAGILVLSLAVPESPVGKHHPDAPSVSAILRQPRVRALLGACFAMSAAHGALYVFYSIHLAANHYSKTEVGLLWSLGVVAEIVVFLFMPRLSRRYSLQTILAVSFAAAVLRFLFIGWGVKFILLAVIAQLMHGLSFGSYHAAAIAAVNHWFPGKAQGRGQALYSSLSFGAGGLLGGLVSGWMWDWIGAAWTYTLSSVFALAGLLLIVLWVRDGEVGQSVEE